MFQTHHTQKTWHPTQAYTTKVWGEIQYAPPDNNFPQLPAERINYSQQVTGVFLYYDISIDNTILVSLGDIGAEKSVATATTNAKVDHLLDYIVSNPEYMKLLLSNIP